jgi:sugar lactone lactonase YvrE
MCLSKDETEVFISAISKYTNAGKIFRYNPTTNAISSMNFSADKNPGTIRLYKDNLIAGAYNDVLYLLDVNSKNIVWQNTLGSGQRINALTVAPNGSIWINYNFLNALTTKLVRFDINATNASSITAVPTEVSVIRTPDNDESTKPNGLVFLRSGQTNIYDLYIAGFKSVCRIKNAVAL